MRITAAFAAPQHGKLMEANPRSMPLPIIQGTKRTVTQLYNSNAAKKNSMPRKRPTKYRTKNSDAVHLILHKSHSTDIGGVKSQQQREDAIRILEEDYRRKKLLCPWITRDMVKHYLKKHVK